MVYCTKQDLVDRFGELELTQLTDRTNRPASVIDDTVVNRAITDAAAFLDGYIGKAYALPLESVPPSVVKAACDVARYYLHARGVEKDSPIQRAYDQALALLRDVAKGQVRLVEDTGAAPPQAGGTDVQFVSPDRIFSRETLRGY
ncbi:Mu-like prophage protein gp36 [Rhizobium sp. RU35A]|uniref:gp436 family protein n=1 Tax=Rhizobium sp. RU35A TaxID=1907414 RepID=UPI0009552CF8|nr:DUF1320 domain-containing protein [Rhizobium sp. RU35A]SIR43174.1 Mu-like prophage protein gp36 [Rhizobium sp. RU35A]